MQRKVFLLIITLVLTVLLVGMGIFLKMPSSNRQTLATPVNATPVNATPITNREDSPQFTAMASPPPTSTESTSTSNPAPQAITLASADDNHIKLLFLGDMMLGRYVRTLMEKTKNLNYPFLLARTTEGPGAHFLSGYFDNVIANLEGPILDIPNRSQTGMSFGFAPDTAQIVKRNGIDIVTIANNHTLDQGEKGLISTKKYLQEAALDFFGHPILPTESDVLIKTIKGKKFAFIGFHDAVRRLDVPAAIALIEKISPQVDYTIIVIHWGVEYKKTPTVRQQELAHKFIDSGADLIIGHHPHIVETSEIYKGVPIYYSLGNFIFDQYFSTETQKGLGVEAVFSTEPNNSTIKIFEHPYDIIRSQPQWK